MSTIEFTNVSVHYDDRLVLNDINLTLTENRIGIIGANGGGKSTLIRLINGLGTATTGTVTVDASTWQKMANKFGEKSGLCSPTRKTRSSCPPWRTISRSRYGV